MQALKEKGQSLIEVVGALAIALIVILALVRVTVTSMRNASLAKNQALATQYAQEGMEKIRAYRDQNTWQDFITNCENESALGLDLLPNPLTRQPPLDCYLPGTTNNCSAAENRCEVKLTVSWTDAQGAHKSELITRLTKWQ